MQTELEQPPKVKLHRPPWLRKWFLGSVSVVVTFLTLCSATLVFLPRLTLSPSSTTIEDGSDATMFHLTNSGQVPIRNIQIDLGICEIAGAAVPPESHEPCKGPLPGGLRSNHWMTSWMWPDEVETFSLEDLIRNFSEISYSDISMIVTFKPAGFSLFQQKKEFKFLMRKLSDGKRHWIPRPVDD
jgi:hypothetical protein